MSLTSEIDELYIHYILLNKDIKQLTKYSKKTLQTLKKYIILKERLDIELFPLLDNRKELTLDVALTMCKEVPNPNIQIQLFPTLKGLTTKNKKLRIIESKQCDICAESRGIRDSLPCCENILCFDCIVSIIEASINGLSFQMICCPYCREDISMVFLKDMFRLNRSHVKGCKSRLISFEDWKNTDKYVSHMNTYGVWYLHNLVRKYRKIKKLLLNEEVTMETHHFGYCRSCIKETYGTNNNFLKAHVNKVITNINRLNIVKVPKDCAQDMELKDTMFMCEPCSNKEKVEVKSCPHCGIKSIKPSNCNYVRCNCGNFWCFVCNVRLPNTHEGHNVHFWRGNGTGPYDDHCRVSTNFNAPKHILQSCNCIHCSRRNGAPMCMNINCKRITKERSDYIEDQGLQYEQYCFVCK